MSEWLSILFQFLVNTYLIYSVITLKDEVRRIKSYLIKKAEASNN